MPTESHIQVALTEGGGVRIRYDTDAARGSGGKTIITLDHGEAQDLLAALRAAGVRPRTLAEEQEQRDAADTLDRVMREQQNRPS